MENYHIALAIFGLLAVTCAANNENRQVVMLPAMPVAIAANASDHWSMDYDLMMSDGGRRGNSMPSWARRYTKKKTGCPCWWDMTLGNICACCKNYKGGIGQPCGYPKHNYCQRKRNIGCPGLLPNGRGNRRTDYERFTLSTRGYPCHYDKSDTSCAWCVLGNQQCGKAGTWANNYLNKNSWMKDKWKKENTCLPMLNRDRTGFAKRPDIACVGQPQDCGEDSECDINARCVATGYKKPLGPGKIWNVKRCACKSGYVGNGITCANENNGIVTRPGVEVKTKLTTDVWEQYKLDTTVEVKNNNNFFRPLEKLLNGGSCGAGCNADVVTCPA